MAFSSLINKHIYAGNDVTTEWPYTFPIISEDGSDVAVYITAPGGSAALITTGYTVDVDNSKVIYPAVTDPLTDPMASGYLITVKRVEPLTQLLDLIAQGDFNAENIETAFDKITMIAQQLKEEISRCLKIGVSYDTDAAETASAYGYAEAAQTAQNEAEVAQGLAETAQAAAEAAQTAAEAAYVATLAALDPYVQGPAANTANYIPQWDGANSKLLKNGVEKSTDAALSGDSDDAIPTEKAVKAYSDAIIALLYKVKADSGDASPNFLDAKVDDSTIEVNGSDKLAVKTAGIGRVQEATAIPINIQVFTGSGTWTKPAGIDKVHVKVWGGGGGGGDTSNHGGDGGTSSFAGSTTPQATGGQGGFGTGGGSNGGVGSNGTLNLTAKDGAAINGSGKGGDGALGGQGGLWTIAGTIPGGGSGCVAASGAESAGGGGGYTEGLVAVTGNVTVTVGAAGAAGSGSYRAGAAGLVIVMY